MTEQQFCYWLQGFVELNPNAMLTATQWQIVKDHLALVFKKETPFRFPNPPVQPVPFPTPTPFPGYPRQPYARLLDGTPPVIMC